MVRHISPPETVEKIGSGVPADRPAPRKPPRRRPAGAPPKLHHPVYDQLVQEMGFAPLAGLPPCGPNCTTCGGTPPPTPAAPPPSAAAGPPAETEPPAPTAPPVPVAAPTTPRSTT